MNSFFFLSFILLLEYCLIIRIFLFIPRYRFKTKDLRSIFAAAPFLMKITSLRQLTVPSSKHSKNFTFELYCTYVKFSRVITKHIRKWQHQLIRKNHRWIHNGLTIYKKIPYTSANLMHRYNRKKLKYDKSIVIGSILLIFNFKTALWRNDNKNFPFVAFK